MNYRFAMYVGMEVYDQMGRSPVRRPSSGGAGGGAGLRRIETKQQARPALCRAPAHMRELAVSSPGYI